LIQKLQVKKTRIPNKTIGEKKGAPRLPKVKAKH